MEKHGLRTPACCKCPAPGAPGQGAERTASREDKEHNQAPEKVRVFWRIDNSGLLSLMPMGQRWQISRLSINASRTIQPGAPRACKEIAMWGETPVSGYSARRRLVVIRTYCVVVFTTALATLSCPCQTSKKIQQWISGGKLMRKSSKKCYA
eukprot:scpid105754/ scgid18737/ 